MNSLEKYVIHTHNVYEYIHKYMAYIISCYRHCHFVDLLAGNGSALSIISTMMNVIKFKNATTTEKP